MTGKQRVPRKAYTFSPMMQDEMRFNVSFTVDMADLANWTVNRIEAFLDGLARVLAIQAEAERRGVQRD